MHRRRLAAVALGVFLGGLIVAGYLAVSASQNQNQNQNQETNPDDNSEPDEFCEITHPDNRT